VGNLPFKFGHARPLGSRIIRYVYATDGQTDGRTDKSSAYCPFPTVGGIINECVCKSNTAHSLWCIAQYEVRRWVQVGAHWPWHISSRRTGVFDHGRGRRRPVTGGRDSAERGQLVSDSDGGSGDDARTVGDSTSSHVVRLDVRRTQHRSQRRAEPTSRDAVEEEIHRVIHIENLFPHIVINFSSCLQLP